MMVKARIPLKHTLNLNFMKKCKILEILSWLNPLKTKKYLPKLDYVNVLLKRLEEEAVKSPPRRYRKSSADRERDRDRAPPQQVTGTVSWRRESSPVFHHRSRTASTPPVESPTYIQASTKVSVYS